MTESQIESIKVARLEPGDVLVLKCSQVLSHLVCQRICDQVTKIVPYGAKVMVLDGGMDAEVLRGVGVYAATS